MNFPEEFLHMAEISAESEIDLYLIPHLDSFFSRDWNYWVLSDVVCLDIHYKFYKFSYSLK